MAPRSLASFVVLAVFTAGCSESSRPTAPGGASTAPLRVNAVSPSFGLPTASTAIQVLGTGFVQGATLTLDGVAASVTFVSSGLLRATAPPHAEGPVDIVVRNPNGESSELKAGFRYQHALSNLTLTGNVSLQAVGETSQLTATALSSDGTTRDVTREALWTVTLPSVATISTEGVLTALALGTTTIQVRLPLPGGPLTRTANVVVTPAGTRAVWGRIREPGAGDISGATVEHPASGQMIQPTSSIFSLGGLSGSLRLLIAKSGYETAEANPGDSAFVDVPMQRVVRIDTGAPQYSSRLAPNDVEYSPAGTPCQPCRLIRIVSSASGSATVTLRWMAAVDLHIWTDGRMIDPEGGAREILATLQVGSGETQIYIGRIKAGSGDYLPFTLSVTGVQ